MCHVCRPVGLGLTCKTIGEIPDKSVDHPDFRFCVSVKQEHYPAVTSPCPGHTLTFVPPIKLVNLLHCPLEYLVVGRSGGGGELAAGASETIHSVNPKQDLNMTFHLPDFEWCEPVAVARATDRPVLGKLLLG